MNYFRRVANHYVVSTRKFKVSILGMETVGLASNELLKMYNIPINLYKYTKNDNFTFSIINN